ncbi:MFS transporter [Geothrix sp. 21YS21S-2]|uniref:MFS transporter n=1 Tax=Geothrix sp. 21YS21S-2 TaxID=3068893 RepID=UPI0027BA96FF|nr:MFS transporter [Geothrix sp. 21YS21S-2]
MNPWRGLQGLPRGMWVLALSTLVNRMGTMVVFFLALYLVRGRGWTEAQAATALALYGLGALAASPFSGWFSDRFGHRFTLALSLGLSAALLLLLPYVPARGLMLAAIALWSAATQAYYPASMALITDLVPPSSRKQAFVLHRLASNLGISVGPALGGFIAHSSFTALFWIDGLTTALGLAVVLAFVPSPPPEPAPALPSLSAWRDRRLLWLLAALLPATAVFTQIHGALPLWVVQGLGHGTQVFGLLFTLNTVLILLLEVAVNHRLAHWTHGRQLALGAGLITLGFGSLALMRPLPLLVLATVAWSLGEMVFLPASTDAVAAMAPPDRRGQYLGLYSLVWTVALTVGPWLGLVAYGWGGPWAVWGGCGLVGLVSVAMAFRTS